MTIHPDLVALSPHAFSTGQTIVVDGGVMTASV